MFGFLRRVFGNAEESEETRLTVGLIEYANAIGLSALLEEGLGEAVIAATQEGRDIDDTAVGDMEWNADRQYFLATLTGEVCINKGIDDAETVFTIVAYVLHHSLNMPKDDLGPYIEAAWAQTALFKNRGAEADAAKDKRLRFAYESALSAAQIFHGTEAVGKAVPPAEDIANFVRMGAPEDSPNVN